MGSEHSQIRRKKGVVYSKETNEIVDCLFCRIAREQIPENQLWYKDELCAVFIPRAPAARLHLLIVPIEHIQNVRSLTENHRFVLEHMKRVALEQLRVHSRHIGSGESRLLPRAIPPSHYGFNRGNLSAICSIEEPYRDEPTPNDSSFDLCFHRPPYNSIDHLHLHAIQKPFRTPWNHFRFGKRFPWHGSLENILDKLPQEKSKL